MNNLMVILYLVTLLPVYIITIFIPYWTRKTESFGVSIPEDIYQTPILQRMRKEYAIYIGILSIITTIIYFIIGSMLGNNEGTLSLLFGTLIVLFMIVSFLVYLKFHAEMKSFKAKENWVKEKSQQIFVKMNFREQKLTYSNLWFLVPIIFAIIIIIFTFQSYQLIPDRIPMQVNFEGEVTNWAEKSYRSVLLQPVMMIYLTLLCLFINVTIAKAKQQIDPDNPEDSIQRNVIFRRRWSAYIIFSSYLLVLLFSFMQLPLIYPISREWMLYIPIGITVVMILVAIILSITTGQGGSRLQSYQAENGTVINRDDDKYWKLGQLYFNKNDPALFLEKRFGIGWTINFARPLAWIIFLAIIGLAIVLPLMLGG